MIGLCALTSAALVNSACNRSTSPPAVPIEPVRAILDAFQTHEIVAMDEGMHGNVQGHSLRLALIRDPRFARTVNDIVVEFGNARYQDRMDRFERGEEVPDAELQEVWQHTTQPSALWSLPIYEAFFRAVRELNASHPATEQIRILLGDPPFDWKQGNGPQSDDWRHAMEERDRFPAELIRREVLARHRRAFVIYGGLHLQRQNIYANYESFPLADTLVSVLERTTPTHAFTIWTHTWSDLKALAPDCPSWPIPSLALVRGTALGAQDFARFFPTSEDRVAIRDGRQVTIPASQWKIRRMEDQFDAILYLGPPSTISRAQR